MAYMKAVEKNKKPSMWKRLKLKAENFMTGLIDKVGFFGILLCASVSFSSGREHFTCSFGFIAVYVMQRMWSF